MKADDPKHGTPQQPATERVAGCHCTRCEAARTKWRRDRKMRKMGRPRLVPVAPVRRHVERLIAAGWTQARIAAEAGVSAATISEARHGVASQMRAETAAKLLQVTDANPDSWRVDSLGTVRRLQALGALGWPSRHVCEMAGLSPRFGALLTGKERTTLTRDAAEAIAAVYDQLHMQPAPEGRTYSHVRAFARNRGWPPPLAYEDIDDPNDIPTDWSHVASDRATAIRDLAEQGENATHIARRLDMTPRALERWCQRHMPDVWRVISSREGDWNSTGNLGHQSRRGDAA